MAGAKSFGLPRISYPINTGDIQFSNSPRLLGRYSAGPGPGEEITLGVFSIAGGGLAVPATAQFELLGRRTAGAGDMEISTRQQMNIAGVDLSNAFTLGQTITSASGSALSVTLTGGTGLRVTADGVTGTNSFSRYQSNSGAPVINFEKARGSLAVPAAVNLNDNLGQYTYRGYGGTAFQDGGQIFMSVIEAAPSDTAMRTRFRVLLSPTGSVTPAETFAADSDGLKAFGTATANIFVDANRGVKRRPLTFATLPAAAANADTFYTITDGAAAPVWGAAAAGGGAVRTPVWSNAAAWLNG